MEYDYDLVEIKESLTIDQIAELVAELGGDPRQNGNILVCRTICHGGDSHKLYYYDNTHLFRCYTGCAEPTFDIFELVRKVKSRDDENYQLPFAIDFVATYFGFNKKINTEENQLFINEYMNSLKNYERIKSIDLKKQTVELKTYEDNFLKYLPRPIILPWIEDGITKEVMDYYEICFDPGNNGIVIPHRDAEGALIGVRERTLIEENAKLYGKYLPMKLGNKMYNHPLSFNLYGLYQNKDNIKRLKKAIVFESEKSVLQYASMFGQENNIAVAICGSSFIQYQAWLLINLGVKEIIVALDRQYQELNDKEHIKLVKNLKNIQKKYGNYVTISFIFDKNKITKYKASPTDEGIEKFIKLFSERENLYA